MSHVAADADVEADADADCGTAEEPVEGLKFLCLHGAVELGLLSCAVEEVRTSCCGVGLAVKAEAEGACVAMLGGRDRVHAAAGDLLRRFALLKERPTVAAFALHFTLRDEWDIPQDDELISASLAADWVDLGGKATHDDPPASPRSVLQGRLEAAFREALSSHDDVFLFAEPDEAGAPGGSMHVILAASLSASTWDDVTRAVLTFEARGIYLSRRYGASFWCPSTWPVRCALEEQVVGAIGHWKGDRTVFDGGFGLSDAGFAGFEVFAANVFSVLRGERPLGWHRLEWTPDGVGAIPYMTY